MKIKWFSILILLLGIGPSLYAYEKADAFIVKVYAEKVRVLSPIKKSLSMAVVVENHTLVKLLGNLEYGPGEVLKRVAIRPGATQSIEFIHRAQGKLYFIPQSPPFQKVELLLGNQPYEIPPQK